MKIKGMKEAQFLSLPKKVLPKTTKDPHLASAIYDEVAKEVRLLKSIESFERTKRDRGQRGTGQIRRKVKEDENGIGIAGARSFSSNTGGWGWGSKQIGRASVTHVFGETKREMPGRKRQGRR